MENLTAWGAQALLLNWQAIGSWTKGNPKTKKLMDWVGARKKIGNTYRSMDGWMALKAGLRDCYVQKLK